MDEKTIQRIKKLQALAERGVGGEKTTAQKKLAKLLKDTGLAYDNKTGKFTATKGITALTAADLTEITQQEIKALFA